MQKLSQLIDINNQKTTASANEKRGYEATLRLFELAQNLNVRLDGVRLTKNGNINTGDLVECVVKHCVQMFKGRHYIPISQCSPKAKRDTSLFHKEVEIKSHLTADRKASFSVENKAKRFLGIYFTSSYEFEVKTFNREECKRNLSKAKRHLNLKDVQDMDIDSDLTEFKDFLQSLLDEVA